MTYICRDPLDNIPTEARDGALEALALAFNVRNRGSKLARFAFSTSEDAVTWVVFATLLRNGQLVSTLTHAGVVPLVATDRPDLLLWGVPIDGSPHGTEIALDLRKACEDLGENAESFSEPDVIVDLGNAGVIIIEVKYRSAHDKKPSSYPGWDKYAGDPHWSFGDVRASGCYELARNWRLLDALAGKRPGALVSLGQSTLYKGPEGKRLDDFIAALHCTPARRFIKADWSTLLQTAAAVPDWFLKFCQSRALMNRDASDQLQ